MAAQHASGILPWIGVDDPALANRTRSQTVDGPGKFTVADNPRHALQKKRGLADLWYMDG